jgi:hypothetical protein
MSRRKKHTPEQVANLLRQREVAVPNGRTTALSCKGLPEHLRSDNGPEFVVRDLRRWLQARARRRSTSSRTLRRRTAFAKAATPN